MQSKSFPNGKTGIWLVRNNRGWCFKEALQCRRSNYLYAVLRLAYASYGIYGSGVRIPFPPWGGIAQWVEQWICTWAENPQTEVHRFPKNGDHNIKPGY
jgi:hypothetical protein